MSKIAPSVDAWLKEAKAHETAPLCGMYLTHNGTVRQTAKAKVRYGAEDTREVTGMYFSYDEEKVNAIIADTYKMEGIYYIKGSIAYREYSFASFNLCRHTHFFNKLNCICRCKFI